MPHNVTAARKKQPWLPNQSGDEKYSFSFFTSSFFRQRKNMPSLYFNHSNAGKGSQGKRAPFPQEKMA
jgi:hypothetical protein